MPMVLGSANAAPVVRLLEPVVPLAENGDGVSTGNADWTPRDVAEEV